MRGNRIAAAALALCAAGSARAAEPWRVEAGADAEAFAPGAGVRRGFATLRYALELDGKPAGWLQAASGGTLHADVVKEVPGASGISKKHIGPPVYDPIQLTFGADMTSEVYAWIHDLLAGSIVRHDGVVVGVDFRGNVRTRLTFFNAILTGASFPGLDATSREPAFLTVVLLPERTQLERNASGRYAGLAVARAGRRWLARDFALAIDGLDTSRVARIDSLVFTRAAPPPIGETRDPQPGPLVVPDLVVTLADSRADSWFSAFDDFVVRGNSADAQERAGTLTFHDASLAPLFKLDLDHLGFFALRPLPSGGDAIARDEAELYLERAAFTLLR